jgi:hypothetical protein
LKENVDQNGVITLNQQDPEPKAGNGENTAKFTAAINGLKLGEKLGVVKAMA